MHFPSGTLVKCNPMVKLCLRSGLPISLHSRVRIRKGPDLEGICVSARPKVSGESTRRNIFGYGMLPYEPVHISEFSSVI